MEPRILQLNLGRLRLEETHGFLSLAGVEFKKVDHPLFASPRGEFEGRLADLDAVLERARRSLLTRRLSEIDARRDAAYRGLAGRVHAGARHFLPGKVEAALLSGLILDRYDNPVSLPYIQENSVLFNLVQDLDTPLERSRLALLDAEEWLDELKSSNDEFITLFSTRGEEQSSALAGSARDARLAATRAYQDCVTRLNALAEVEGTDALAPVIASLNWLVEYQKNVLRARDGRKGKASEQETGTETGAETENEEQSPVI
jgi:hypothetical protein